MSRIVFMGTPSFAVPALEALAQAGQQVVAVYTQPDRPAGRGRRLTPPPVKVWAQEHGLPVYQPATLRSPVVAEQVRSLGPEALAVAAYGKLLPQAVLEIPPKGALNIHPSLLPKLRGPSPIPSAILSGEAVTGVTIMLVDAGMDSGPILAQEREAIEPQDTAASLEERLARRGARLLAETLERWLRDAIQPVLQSEAEATYCRRVTKEEGEIDWRGSAAELSRRVRAFWPWPGCSTTWHGVTLRIVEAAVLEGPLAEPGTVVEVAAPDEGGRGVAVATGQGLLLLRRVQPADKRIMMAREFIAGHRGFVGSRLPS